MMASQCYRFFAGEFYPDDPGALSPIAPALLRAHDTVMELGKEAPDSELVPVADSQTTA